MRSDYAAAKEGRYRRKRSGLDPQGSSADRHYRNESDFLRIMEYARDMDRNDAIVGQLVDRVVLNTLQGGFSVDPQTGDKELDKHLWELFNAWATDPSECDAAATDDFSEMSDLVFRSMLVDGDIFGLALKDGRLEIMEGHRCRTPSGKKEQIVHGVEMDKTRRPEVYHFTQDDINPNGFITKRTGFSPVQARDRDGLPLVFHVAKRKRKTQTRGVSAFAPVFDVMGMFEDLQFAKLVQAQVVSCIAFMRTRVESAFPGAPVVAGAGQTGSRETETQTDGTTRTIDGIAPGMQIDCAPGEKIEGFSPNVPNAEFFQHVRLILQMVGVNLGVPLVMVLMDASDTNFSGWRGAVDEARRGFRRNQQLMVRRWHTPVYRWKLVQFAEKSPDLTKRMKEMGAAFFNHRWNTPNWPYIQPKQDAEADAYRVAQRLTSPRRLHNERGQDVDEVLAETIADNSMAIRAAIMEANKISAETKTKVDWREVLFLSPPNAVTPDTDEEPGDAAPSKAGKVAA